MIFDISCAVMTAPAKKVAQSKASRLSGLHLHAREVNMVGGSEHGCEAGDSAGW